MRRRSVTRSAATWLAAAAGAAAGAYASYVALTWMRYGQATTSDQPDDLLDVVMPVCDVRERHQIHVAAPPAITLAAAAEMDLLASPVARAIVRAREAILGATRRERPSRALLEEVQALGWGILAERPGREIVVGAVTQPWEADVVFHAVAPERFAAFDEPGYVKIAWTLRADPDGPSSSIFRTETRAIATDAHARAKFRWYWATLSPGILIIRRTLLGPLRREAERRARNQDARQPQARTGEAS